MSPPPPSDSVSPILPVLNAMSCGPTAEELHPFSIVEVTGDQVIVHSKEEYDKLVWEEFGALRQDKQLIQFIQDRSVRSIAVVQACLLSSRPFVFLRPGVSPTEFRPNWVLDKIKQCDEDKADQKRCLFAKEQICYAIRTSGSTGKPKLVAVPNRAIWPNILDFRNRFQVTKNDRILFSTSVLFDPSIVEIFLCMLTGATMIHVTDEIRSSPHLLLRVIQEQKPTFVQCTPALFKMFNFTSTNRKAMDSVRTILMGGEKFPLSFVQTHWSTHFPSARIFDVYGVTEISCWATVYEVDKDCQLVSLGSPIEKTTIRMGKDGAVYIEGSRLCIVNGVEPISHPTGDWAIQTTEGIVLQGRLDNIKKINGVKLNLEDCADVVLSNLPQVDFARFLVWKEEYLVLFVKFGQVDGKSEEELHSLLRHHCPPNLPVTILTVEEIPLTNNGKVDNERLLAGIEATYTDQWRTARFWEILGRHGIQHGMTDAILVDYGVKSLTAAELAIVLGDGAAIREILSEGTTVDHLVKKYLEGKETCSKPGYDGTRFDVSITVGPELKCQWEHDLKKCIDGNPLLISQNGEEYVVAASHSGMIVCRNHTKKIVHWEHSFPGRRFEASPALSNGQTVIVGSYDGHLIAVDFSTGRLLRSHLFEDSTIRAEVAVYGDVIFIIAYKTVAAELIMFRWRDRKQKCLPLAAGSTASPVVLPERRMLIVTTIRGTVEAFQFSDDFQFEPLWKTVNIAKAIFSPVCVDSELAIVTSADGVISKLNISTGQVEKTLNIGEAFFAGVFLFDDVYLASSQAGSLFVLDKNTMDILRIFSFPGCSFVKSPSIIPHCDNNFLALISKDGRLLIFRGSGSLCHKTPHCISYKIGTGEIFGEPRFSSDVIFIGSRDDHLRAIFYPDLRVI